MARLEGSHCSMRRAKAMKRDFSASGISMEAREEANVRVCGIRAGCLNVPEKRLTKTLKNPGVRGLRTQLLPSA